MKPFVKVAGTIAGIVAVYFAAFYLLMETGRPAVNDDLEVVFTCGFRYGEMSYVIIGGRTRPFREVSFWNIIFAPAEWLHTAECADRISEAWRTLAPLNTWLRRRVGPSR